jgi:16S rRNA G966 N2-methylase RsmD
MTTLDKNFISKQIKNISLKEVEREMEQLIEIGKTDCSHISSRSRVGNKVVDYFTFTHRLETKGKYNTNFYEFIENIEEFKKKKFIQTMLTYYKDVKNKNGTKNEYKVLKEVYNICISAINIMRPLNCIEIYKKYHAKRVLNFCAGWGGSAVGAAALDLDAFYGIEINTDLKGPYDRMVAYLKSKCKTDINIQFCDAVEADYSLLNYDIVFSSPPYYEIEKYANNVKYNSKKEMEELFYKPLFIKSYNGLQKGGHYIINICVEVYENVLKNLFGAAGEIFPLKKSKRQNNYTEFVYVWKRE